jgi:hypothetical protein
VANPDSVISAAGTMIARALEDWNPALPGGMPMTCRILRIVLIAAALLQPGCIFLPGCHHRCCKPPEPAPVVVVPR